jgi:hypothetical protein
MESMSDEEIYKAYISIEYSFLEYDIGVDEMRKTLISTSSEDLVNSMSDYEVFMLYGELE